MSGEAAARAKGVWVYDSPVHPIAEEAKKHQRQLQDEAAIRSAERREHRYNTMPNRVCYPALYAEYQARVAVGGSRKLYKCKRCHGILHWEEHHDCPGFRPRYRVNPLPHEERVEMRRAGWDDWDDDQYDPTTPDETTHNLRMRHEAETGATYDQVVIDGMTEEEYLTRKFGYVPNFEDFEE